MADSDVRKSKMITKAEDVEYLINIKESDITTTFISEAFAEFDTGRRFNPYDLITIPAGYYGIEGKKNKKPFTTTVGLWVFNKYFIEPHLFNLFGYINDTIGKKIFGKINSKLSEALLEDKITTDDLKDFMMKTQKCMPYISILSPSYTNKMLTCSSAIAKKKEEVIAANKEGLEKGDGLVADKVEKELLDYAVSYMGDDPSMDMFNSGARGSLENNFKNIFVMKGAMKDPDPNAKQKYKIAKSCYIDGISKEDYAAVANSLAAGAYARSKQTETGGYLEKLFLRAYQYITLDPPGSDCGTKRYATVELTDSNVKDWMYSFIVEGSNLVELTGDNKSKYIGKTVKVRFSALCESKTGICNKCAGNLYYRLGYKKNIGTSLTKVASVQKNIAMKAFHDSTQSFYTMDLEKVFEA